MAFALFIIALVWPLQRRLQAVLPQVIAVLVTAAGALLAVGGGSWLVVWGFGGIVQWVIANAARLHGLYMRLLDMNRLGGSQSALVHWRANLIALATVCARHPAARSAQTLANGFSPDVLRRVLDRYVPQCCPVRDVFVQSDHWSFMQVEYATDLVFRSPAILKPLYQQLSRQAILTVKAEHVATFLGHTITAQLAQQIGSQFATRIEGTCVRHRFGKSSIKIYDKFGLVLRLETTTNDASAFKHYRKSCDGASGEDKASSPLETTGGVPDAAAE